MLEAYAKVVVTGGAGFIGRHLVRSLLLLGKEVVVFDNLSTSMDQPLPQGATLVEGDIRDQEAVAGALSGASLLFHLAANASGTVSIEAPRFDFETNAVGTFNVMEAASLAGVGRVVYMSSASVYGVPRTAPVTEEHPINPFMPEGATKLAGELMCRASRHSRQLFVSILRPPGVYGPGENPNIALVEVARYLRWHLNDQPIQVIGNPDSKTRDFVHVSDLVEALCVLADRGEPGEAYNVGTGREVTMRELVEIVGEATGRTPVMDVDREVTDDTFRLVPDFSKLRALGYEPKAELTEEIRALAAHLGDRPELPGGATIFSMGQKGER